MKRHLQHNRYQLSDVEREKLWQALPTPGPEAQDRRRPYSLPAAGVALATAAVACAMVLWTGPRVQDSVFVTPSTEPPAPTIDRYTSTTLAMAQYSLRFRAEYMVDQTGIGSFVQHGSDGAGDSLRGRRRVQPGHPARTQAGHRVGDRRKHRYRQHEGRFAHCFRTIDRRFLVTLGIP